MASVILTNWTVYYSDDSPAGSSGYKQIRWTGAGAPETNTNTTIELYSAIADLFSISAQNNANDTIPIQAVTATAFNIGSFDAGDLEPWFIDPDSVKHLTGGAIQTVNWTRVQDSNAGILKVPYTVGGGAQFVASDIGRAIVNGTATGTLLWYDTANSHAWIRPTNFTSTHNWAGPAGTITVTDGTGSVTQNGAATTGERLWSNAFTLGTIETNTQMFVYQNFVKITNFWSAGHMNRLFLINDGFASGLIDSGLLTVYAREYTKFYDHFITDTSGGGNNPVPIATIADVNNQSGYYQTVFSSSTGTWAAGQTFTKDGDSTREGTVTSATGSNPDTIQYYLSGISLTPFSNGDAVTSSGGGPATGNVQTPTSVGPANLAAITITFGATSQDIGDGDGDQPYDVLIDVGGNTLANFYEYTKYITRRGNTADIDSGGQTVIGERYFSAGSVRLSYDSQTVNFLQGATLTGQTSGATGVITADHDNGTTGTLIVRDVRGDFEDNENIQDDQGTPGNADIIATGGIVFTTVIKGSPFGTLAGVNFFGARGVWIENMHANDANSYELIDSNGVSRTPPASVSVVVNGLVSGDSVSVFRATDANGTIDKTYLTLDAGNNLGNTTLVVNETIPTDTPASGIVRIIDNDDDTSTKDRRYSYTSITAPSTFNGIVKLFGALDAGLDRNYTATLDTAYVPYIDTTATGSTASVSVIFDEIRNITTRVRKKGILPFTTNTTQLTSSGYSATAVRTTDTIVN